MALDWRWFLLFSTRISRDWLDSISVLPSFFFFYRVLGVARMAYFRAFFLVPNEKLKTLPGFYWVFI